MLLNYANVLEHTDNKQSVGLDIKEQIVDNVLVEYLHWQPISFFFDFFIPLSYESFGVGKR